MQNFTLKDTQNLLHDIEELYSLYDLNSFCEKALAIVNRHCNSMVGNELLQENFDVVGIASDPSQRNSSDRDLLIFNLLDSYLFQAYCNDRCYNQLEQNLTQLHQSLDCLGLIILNASGQIQFITSQAREYLQIYFAQPVNQLEIPDHLWNWVKYQMAYFT